MTKAMVNGDEFAHCDGRSATVIVVHDGAASSTASANRGLDEEWWVVRVKVDEAHRGKGVGTRVLQRLVALVREAGVRKLHVSPGGYNSDPEELRAFYRRNGFVDAGQDVLEIVFATRGCEHEFVGPRQCAKCGWEPPR